MKHANGSLNKFFLLSVCFFIIFSIQIKGVYSQQSDFSFVAEDILNKYVIISLVLIALIPLVIKKIFFYYKS